MHSIASYLRSHRMKSGLNRRELAEIVGLFSEVQLGRQERSVAIPSLLAALSYQAVFKIPIAELFPGLYETVVLGIEERLSELEKQFHDSSAKGRGANRTARKLEWIAERANSKITDLLG